MQPKEQVYRWEWEFEAPPAALWPFVSNTDRFNRDCGFPAVTVVSVSVDDPPLASNRRRIRTRVLGATIEWDEKPFEWVEPSEFSIHRAYRSGPVREMLTSCRLATSPQGGTALTYEMRILPSGLAGRLTIPTVIGRFTKRTVGRVLRTYDAFALRGEREAARAAPARLAPGGAQRLAAAETALVQDGRQRSALVTRLSVLLRTAEESSLARLRCYAVADAWREGRRETLSLFLHATRAGILDFSWDIVCPHCRGAKRSEVSLLGITQIGRCDACDIDFAVDFDQSVELTFSPNPAVRAVEHVDFCVGGPQITPHIVAQIALTPGEARTVALDLRPGRYRVRRLGQSRYHSFRVAPAGAETLAVRLDEPPRGEGEARPRGSITIAGESGIAVIEHLSWTDQATSAAEVTALQVFRDLFAREVLRPGENISVGAMCVVFTDLKNSTQMYRTIGDGPAFGRVLTHFDILREEIGEHSGAIVKTMGDAVMAVFPYPRDALVAITRTRRRLAELGAGADGQSALRLKAGIHSGPCLAINQNDHLDYFGTTVNLAARLCGLCSGADLVISPAVAADASVAAFLADPASGLEQRPDQVLLNGFGAEPVSVLRVSARD